MRPLRSAAFPWAAPLLGFLSVFLLATVQGVVVKDKNLHRTNSEAAAAPAAAAADVPPTAALVATLQVSGNSNPFLEPPLADFMSRFDIPKNHGSGIYVDLGSEKEVDGQMYREPSGRCPVFGKNIQLHQPPNNPHYKNDFLVDIPSKAESDAAGNPLPGGFNNSFKLPDKTPYSPMTAAKLNSFSQLKAKTPLGRCAELSYKTTAGRNSLYRYPFVYDTQKELCYFLFIPMQRLMGERYCSYEGNPPDLTWYCFQPKKSPSLRPQLVYGSAYVGENPDDWETKCPNKAVANAVFGVWEGGRCQEHRRRKGAKKEKVNSKEDCWILAFENPGVASDHPVTDDEKVGTLGYYFPTVEANQPKSGGEGVNYGSYYPSSKECWLSDEVPNCLVPMDGAVAYTALGGLDEEAAPCTDSFPPTSTPCDPSTCTITLTSCVNGALVSKEVACPAEESNVCEGSRFSAVMIGLAAAGGILLLLLAGGGFALYRSRRGPARKGEEATRSDYVQEEAAANRKKQRQSDLVQQAEPSFWEEAEADENEGAENTHVLVDQDY